MISIHIMVFYLITELLSSLAVRYSWRVAKNILFSLLLILVCCDYFRIVSIFASFP